MTNVPTEIDGSVVLLAADVRNSIATGATSHGVGGADAVAVDFSFLVIAQFPGEDDVYLFYCDDDWGPVTDTLHESVADAVAQAEFEFEAVQFVRPSR